MNLAKWNVVLLVAAVGLAVPTSVQLFADAESFVDVSRIPLLFDGFTAENVGSVALGTPKKEQPPANPQNPGQKPQLQYDQVSLVRTDKGWALGANAGDLAGAPVNKDKVENDVFAHLRKIRRDREALVQANASAEQLKEYGLDEEHASLLKVNDRNNQAIVAELFIGREAGEKIAGAEAVRGVFVRKADSTDVILYEYDKGWMRGVQPELWLDKVLLKLEPTAVQKLSLRNAATGAPVVLAKSGNAASWSCGSPPAGRGAVRQAEVEAFVQRLRWMTAQDFRQPLARVGNLAQLGLQPPQLELEITYKDGDAERAVKFSVGAKVDGKNEYYLLCSENQFLMTWPAALVTAFEVNAADAWFDPAGATEVPKDPAPAKEPGK